MTSPTAPPRPIRRAWSSRSIGSRLQHGSFRVLLRAGGLRAAYALLYPVVAWYTLFRPSVRRRSSYYLARRFPGRSLPGRLLDSYRLALELGKALVDRDAVALLPPGAVSATLRERGALLDLLREGRGLILLISHVGSWQAMLPALNLLRTPVNLLIQREEGDVDRHYFELRGEPCPFTIIDPRGYLGGAIEMAGALKRGEVLCVMGDRVFGDSRGVLPVDFLGAPAPFPTGPYRIAAATGAPIAVLFSVKTAPATYDMAFAGVLRVPPGAGRDPEACREHLEAYVRMLEQCVERHPFQFFNFFDLWANPDGGTVPAGAARDRSCAAGRDGAIS
jgi:predicted LPLAT superfamily acyltransferase